MKALTTVALATLVLAASATQDGVLLRRTYAPNTEDRYSMAMDMKFAMDPSEAPNEMKSTMTYVVSIHEVSAEGTADVTLEMSDFKIETDEPIEEDDMAEDFKISGKMDNRLRLSDLKPLGDEEEAARAREMLEGYSLESIVLPEGPVKVGDTWDFDIASTQVLSSKPMTVKVRFDGERKVDGKDYYVLTIDDTVTMDIDPAELMDEEDEAEDEEFDPSMLEGLKMTSTAVIKIECLLEKQTCRVYSSDGSAVIDSTASAPSAGFDMTMRMEMSFRLKLKDQGAT